MATTPQKKRTGKVHGRPGNMPRPGQGAGGSAHYAAAASPGSSPLNQTSGVGDTRRPQTHHPQTHRPSTHHPSSGGSQAPPVNLDQPNAQGLYSWGKGGYVHTIPLAQHTQNQQPLDAPLSYGGAMREANAAADLQYGPQIQAAQQLVTNVPVWFQNYMAQVAGYKTAAANQYQPILDQAGGMAAPATDPAKAAAQLPPGLDPNSAAGQQALQAAQGRGQLASLGQQALQANASSAGDYFGALGAAAAAQQPGAQTAAANALASAQTQRGQAVTKYMGDARANAQNYAIARGTLGLNTEKAAADVASDTARTAETHRHNTASEKNAAANRKAAADARGQTVNKYGYTNEQWQRFSAEHRRRIIRSFEKGGGTTAAQDKEAKKHADAITKTVGKARTDIQDIMDAWKRGATAPAPTDQDKNATRPATRDELRKALSEKFGNTMVEIMERVRKHQQLTGAQIRYLRDKYGPDFRLPREWGGQEHGAQGSGGNAPAQGGSRPT